MKTSVLAASVLALALTGPAVAQTAAPSESPSQKMERMENKALEAGAKAADKVERAADKAADTAERAADKASNAASKAADKVGAAVTAATTSDHGSHWRASTLIGTAVVNPSNESVGDINDLLIANNGTVAAVIVGVGGFLGIGEKNVSLPFNELTYARNADGKAVITSKVTKDTLEKMPEWKKPATK